MRVDPTLLMLIGLAFNTLGSLILAADALGAPELIAQLNRPSESWEARKAHVGFLATVNQIFVMLLFTLIAFCAVLMVGWDLDPVLLIAAAPTFFLVWRGLAWLTWRVMRAVPKLNPAVLTKGRYRTLGFLVYALAVIPYLILLMAAYLLHFAVAFGLDLPLRFFSERVIGPRVLRWLRRLAYRIEHDRLAGLRKYAAQGIVLLFVGFLYQAIGACIYLARL